VSSSDSSSSQHQQLSQTPGKPPKKHKKHQEQQQPSTSGEADLTGAGGRRSARSKASVKLAERRDRAIPVGSQRKRPARSRRLAARRARHKQTPTRTARNVTNQNILMFILSISNSAFKTVPARQQERSSWSKSQKPADSTRHHANRKETGGCISKPLDTAHSSHTKSQSRSAASQEPATAVAAAPGATPLVAVEPLATNPTTSQAPHEKPTNMSGQQQQQQQQQQSKSAKAASSSKTTAPLLSESGADSSDNDASEFSRLSDILQSRGLPSHIVNAFGSKVQQFLHRTMSSGIGGRSQSLISSLQQPDDSLKLTALAEICQLLVMGNEDTLVGFPIKQAVPLLLACMSGDSENFDLMNHACRALTYMMESLPRSSGVIAADGIGVFLEKLQVTSRMKIGV